MTVPDASLLITAASSMTAALVSVAGVFISLRNSRKITEIKTATDGMKTELVNEVRSASLAKGKLAGAAEEKANPT